MIKFFDIDSLGLLVKRLILKPIKVLALISQLNRILSKIKKKYNSKAIIFHVDEEDEFQSSDHQKHKDPKIIGIFLTWNNIEWFKYAIKQALEFCDEVLLVEGCHFNKYPRRSTDGTVEFLNTIKNHKKLRIFNFNITDRNDVVQLKIRTSLLKYSNYCKPGNWIIQWDDDNFFFEEDLRKIKSLIRTTDFDTILFRERRFIFNFKFNTFSAKKPVFNRGGGQIDRITPGAYFKGIIEQQTHPRLYYKDGTKYNRIIYLDDLISFHYHHIKKPERVKARWEISLEKGNLHNKDHYHKFMTIRWDNENEIYQFKEIIENLNGEVGFNIYNGPHPKILDNHPWRNIEDVRKVS